MKTDAYLRFKKFTKTTPTCWLWTGRVNNCGYGRFWSGSESVYAHRWSYEHHIGPIPKGLHILHSCDTPACVNPAHLRPGTALENIGEAAERGRIRSEERHGMAKLTKTQVRYIRAQAEKGRIHQSIADEVGIHRRSVGKIVSRELWKHVS